MSKKLFHSNKKYAYYATERGEILRNNRPMKGHLHANGYRRVSIMSMSESPQRVHRLVAQAFIPNPNGKPFVNHIDGDRSNNCVTNLEWSTPEENTRNAIERGVHNVPMYINGYKIIKNMQSSGYSAQDIHEITGVAVDKIELCLFPVN